MFLFNCYEPIALMDTQSEHDFQLNSLIFEMSIPINVIQSYGNMLKTILIHVKNILCYSLRSVVFNIFFLKSLFMKFVEILP